MTTFLFANVAVSGIKILSSAGGSRRSRFIVACSMGLGLGVTIAPAWATNNLWPCSDCGEELRVRRKMWSVVRRFFSWSFEQHTAVVHFYPRS